VFSALADPTRRAIVVRLAEGQASVPERARPFDVSLPAIAKHLESRERADLLEHQRRAGCATADSSPRRCGPPTCGAATTRVLGAPVWIPR
jgi:predicted ArsR family transcriptional regulator